MSIDCALDPYERFNTLRPRQNGRHFADDIFKCILLNKNAWIPNKISLKFVPEGQINNIPSLVQIMAWRRPGDKPLSEPTWLVHWRIYASLGLSELNDQIQILLSVRSNLLSAKLLLWCSCHNVLQDMDMHWIPSHVGRLDHVPAAEQSLDALVSGFVKLNLRSN